MSLDILEKPMRARVKACGSPGKASLPAREGKDTPSRERPLAAPKTPKNADIKKDSLALYGLSKVCKITHIKKDFVTTVFPHPAEAQGNAPETGVGRHV